jgi:predicted DNA-binding transcriptional regulator AlpA
MSRRTDSAPSPLLVDVRDAAAMVGCARRTWLSWSASGRTPASVKLGALRRWSVEDLRAWVALGCPPRAEFEARKKGGAQ